MTGDYCGFCCSDVTDMAREITKQLEEFAEHNPEEAKNVMRRVITILVDSPIVQYDGTKREKG